PLSRRERALERREGHLAEQADHGDAVVHREAATRRVRREVGRTEHAVGSGEIRREVALTPDPVAECDHVCARGEDPRGDLRRDAASVGGVLAVDDAEVGAQVGAQVAQLRLDGPATRRAEHVGHEQDSQRACSVAEGWTSTSTWFPASFVYRESAWCSTPEKSSTVPSFDASAVTIEPTLSDGSAARCEIETMSDGASIGWMSIRAP